MPKDRKETPGEFIVRMKNQFPNVFRSDKSVLFCSHCNCLVSAKKIFQVKQHIDSVKHKDAQERKKQNSEREMSQLLISNYQQKHGPNLSEFNMDLCKTLIEANIPLNKVNHPSVVQFIEKYTSQSVPDQSTLRRNYVPHLYEKSIEKLRLKADGKHIWVTLDETTDIEKRSVANFVFGILDDENERGKSYLLNVKELDKCNANTIVKFFTESLLLLWPKGIQYENVMLVTTDAAAYMISAMKSLQVLFPKMLHVTCFAHGLHRLVECIRSEFHEVNLLISKVKATFVKVSYFIYSSNSYIEKTIKFLHSQLFKQANPNIPLPPEPIVTRRGTWLQACDYYADKFDAVKSVVDYLNDADSECIRDAKKAFRASNIRQDLAFIKANFMFIADKIKILESKGLELKKCIELYEEVHSILGTMTDDRFLKKFEEVLSRNVGYSSLLEINDILNGDSRASASNEYITALTPCEITFFKFAVATSVDVERSFSTYKSILTEKRRCFSFDSLKQHLVLTCNNELL